MERLSIWPTMGYAMHLPTGINKLYDFKKFAPCVIFWNCQKRLTKGPKLIELSHHNDEVIICNSQCLPNTELYTKNSTKQPHYVLVCSIFWCLNRLTIKEVTYKTRTPCLNYYFGWVEPQLNINFKRHFWIMSVRPPIQKKRGHVFSERKKRPIQSFFYNP